MGTFRVELKKTVDDSYDIEVGRALAGRLVKGRVEEVCPDYG